MDPEGSFLGSSLLVVSHFGSHFELLRLLRRSFKTPRLQQIGSSRKTIWRPSTCAMCSTYRAPEASNETRWVATLLGLTPLHYLTHTFDHRRSPSSVALLVLTFLWVSGQVVLFRLIGFEIWKGEFWTSEANMVRQTLEVRLVKVFYVRMDVFVIHVWSWAWHQWPCRNQ